MKATLTSKGQITIPIDVRNRLHLKPGDVLDFDERAPYLKATKIIPPHAWEAFALDWVDHFDGLHAANALDEFRGLVELPKNLQQR